MTAAEASTELGYLPATLPGGVLAAFSLPAVPESACAARGRVRAALNASGLGALADDAAVIASELVANAVRHAANPADVRLVTVGGRLVIIVGDASPVPPAMSLAADDAVSGAAS